MQGPTNNVTTNHVSNTGVVQQNGTQVPVTAPTAQVGVRVVRQVAPLPITDQLRNIGNHFMQRLENPWRALSDLASTTRSNFLRNNTCSQLERGVRGWFFSDCLHDVADLRAQHLAREPEFNRRGLQRLFADLTRAFDDVLETNVGPGTHEELERLIGLADMAISTPLTATERLSDGTPDRPGAYHVTAAAAAAVGRYGNAAPPLREPKAIAVVGIDKDQLPADIIGRTAKTPKNPNGHPVVHAENVTEVSHDIPLVRAYRADLLTPNPANDSSL